MSLSSWCECASSARAFSNADITASARSACVAITAAGSCAAASLGMTAGAGEGQEVESVIKKRRLRRAGATAMRCTAGHREQTAAAIHAEASSLWGGTARLHSTQQECHLEQNGLEHGKAACRLTSNAAHEQAAQQAQAARSSELLSIEAGAGAGQPAELCGSLYAGNVEAATDLSSSSCQPTLLLDGAPGHFGRAAQQHGQTAQRRR